jgi:hypothetical protein
VAFLFFPDFIPPLAAALAAIAALSRSLRLSALARLVGDSAFLGAGIGPLEVETYRFHPSKPPIHTSRYAPRAPRGTPADLERARGSGCSKAPGAGPRGNTRSPRTQRLWTRSSAARPSTADFRKVGQGVVAVAVAVAAVAAQCGAGGGGGWRSRRYHRGHGLAAAGSCCLAGGKQVARGRCPLTKSVGLQTPSMPWCPPTYGAWCPQKHPLVQNEVVRLGAMRLPPPPPLAQVAVAVAAAGWRLAAGGWRLV